MSPKEIEQFTKQLNNLQNEVESYKQDIYKRIESLKIKLKTKKEEKKS
tara:strand:- start:1947 stop:2090 length:144 start_codon:yes stop_codon:yes gene_type:complete